MKPIDSAITTYRDVEKGTKVFAIDQRFRPCTCRPRAINLRPGGLTGDTFHEG